MKLVKHNADGTFVEKDVLDAHAANILKTYPYWTKPGEKPPKGAFEIKEEVAAPRELLRSEPVQKLEDEGKPDEDDDDEEILSEGKIETVEEDDVKKKPLFGKKKK